MKILYITNGIDGSGGLERVLSIKASLMAEDSAYEVHILVLNAGQTDTFFPFSDKIRVHAIHAAGNPVQYYRQYKAGINKVANEVQPDLISVCDDGLKGFWVPALLQWKCPIIYERHASVLIDAGSGRLSRLKNRVIHRIMQSRVASFDRFVVLTEGNRREWKGSNVTVIPNPIAGFPERKANLQSSRVIAVGSQSYNKGYDRLLKVWQEVHQIYPDWHLQVYGRKNEALGLEALAKSLGIAQVVSFNDPVADIQDKYLESSIMVLPSRSEGFGMVLVEAMACGLPCVAFDCPHGPRDIVTDGVDGFLVDDGDIGTFSEKVKLLIRDPQLRQQLGDTATAAAARYAPQYIVRQWTQLFQQLCTSR